MSPETPPGALSASSADDVGIETLVASAKIYAATALRVCGFCGEPFFEWRRWQVCYLKKAVPMKKGHVRVLFQSINTGQRFRRIVVRTERMRAMGLRLRPLLPWLVRTGRSVRGDMRGTVLVPTGLHTSRLCRLA